MSFGYWIALISIASLAAALVWKWRRAGWTSRWFMASCTLASGAIFALSMTQRTDFIASMLLVNGAPYNFAGMRYQLFPAALLLLALLVPVDLPRGAIADPVAPTLRSLAVEYRQQRLVLAAATVWLLIAFVPSYRLDTARSTGPDWGAGVGSAAADCRASGAPDEPVFISPAPAWVVVVPCSVLTG